MENFPDDMAQLLLPRRLPNIILWGRAINGLPQGRVRAQTVEFLLIWLLWHILGFSLLSKWLLFSTGFEEQSLVSSPQHIRSVRVYTSLRATADLRYRPQIRYSNVLRQVLHSLCMGDFLVHGPPPPTTSCAIQSDETQGTQVVALALATYLQRSMPSRP